MSLPILRRINQDDRESIDYAIEDGFDYIGSLHTYSLKIDYGANDIKIVRGTQKHLRGCVGVGLKELRDSRLYGDRKIPFEMAQAVYRERITHAFDHNTVFVAVTRVLNVVGFCSLGENEIELIAVDKGHQQKGVGQRLIEQCIDECQKCGFANLLVKTQGRNRPARNLYEKMGFHRTKIEKDFHKHEDIANGT